MSLHCLSAFTASTTRAKCKMPCDKLVSLHCLSAFTASTTKKAGVKDKTTDKSPLPFGVHRVHHFFAYSTYPCDYKIRSPLPFGVHRVHHVHGRQSPRRSMLSPLPFGVHRVHHIAGI